MRLPFIFIDNDTKVHLQFIVFGSAMIVGGLLLFFPIMNAHGWNVSSLTNLDTLAISFGATLLIVGPIFIVIPLVSRFQVWLRKRSYYNSHRSIF
jgi:hypothetical protein